MGGYVLCLAFAAIPRLLMVLLERYCPGRITSAMDFPVLLLTLFFLFLAVPDKSWPKWLVSCSFPIYLIHIMVLTFLPTVFHVVGLKCCLSHSSAGLYVAYWAIVVFVSIGIAHLFKRLPWLALIAFGGR